MHMFLIYSYGSTGSEAELQIVSEQNLTKCKLVNLTPFTNYTAYVSSYNRNGIATSNKTYFMTAEGGMCYVTMATILT